MGPSNWVPRPKGRRARRNPAAPLTGEVEGGGVGLTTDRFAAKEGSGAAPARGLGGVDRHRPLEHALRRLGGVGWSMHGRGCRVRAREGAKWLARCQ
jgi:hypothetical protein